MTEDIVKLISQPGSPIILVFFSSRVPVPNSKGTPSAGRKIQGVGTFCNFRPKSPFISETVRDRPMFAMERQ